MVTNSSNRKNKSLDQITSNNSSNITVEIVVPVTLALIATVLLILAVFVFRSKIARFFFRAVRPQSPGRLDSLIVGTVKLPERM